MSRFLTLVGLSILFSWFYNVDCHATYFGIRQCDKGESYMLSFITIDIFKEMSVTTNHFKLIYINIFMSSPLHRASSIKCNRLSFQKKHHHIYHSSHTLSTFLAKKNSKKTYYERNATPSTCQLSEGDEKRKPFN